jgi:hypothetical protein
VNLLVRHYHHHCHMNKEMYRVKVHSHSQRAAESDYLLASVSSCSQRATAKKVIDKRESRR